MKIFVIGTNHAHQMLGNKHGFAFEFLEFIDLICEIKKVDFVAEELNEEALLKHQATDSVCRVLARKNSIIHIFCDPDSKERARLGIPSFENISEKLRIGKVFTAEQDYKLKMEERRYWSIREDYWIEKIFSESFQNCLVVCGSEHIAGLNEKLSISTRNLSFEVITEKWGGFKSQVQHHSHPVRCADDQRIPTDAN
jgi:hypothetical protein